ncbi:MAG: hypothetical protein GEU99_23300 [Luteitalea sp.]|nr:hypothetical protein [Luteitalea sp.]
MHRLKQSVALAGLVSLWSTGASSQTVDELVQKNLAALGGEAALRRVEAIQSSGTMTGPKGQKAELTTWTKRPNMRRQDVQVDGQTITNAFDGKDLWIRHPRMGDGPQVMGGDAVESAAGASFDPPFLDYEARDIDVELQGTVQVDGKTAYKLQLSYPKGPSPIVYLDETTGLVLRTIIQDEVEGKKVAREERFSDWRNVAGIMLPFRTETLMNGRPMTTVTLSKVRVNPQIDASLFRMQGSPREIER